MEASSLKRKVMVVGIDDSNYSTYALDWALDHLIAPSLPNPIFKVVLVYAKPTAATVVGLIGPGMSEALPIMDADYKRIAAKVIEQAKQLCLAKSVNDPITEVMEGDPRIVLCEAVDKHHASMLVLGSHGYGAIKRAVLGSVSDYCAHHAHCNVMIVKKPKTNH